MSRAELFWAAITAIGFLVAGYAIRAMLDDAREEGHP